MRRAVAVILAAQLAYLLVIGIWGRFLAGDEIAYKASGREWAQSGRFVAPELAGFAHWVDPANPEAPVRGYGPPLYTFFFGVFVKVFGFNPTTNVLYDALIHVALSWAAFVLARAFGASPPWAAAAAVLVLPLGTAGRPDELGMTLALFGLACALRSRVVAAGVLYGLAAGASLPAAGLLTIPLFLVLGRRVLLFGVVSAVVFAMVMTPLTFAMPDGPSQIFRLGERSVSRGWLESVLVTWHYGKQHLFVLLAALVVTRLDRRWLGAWLIVIALALLLPAKYYYFWIPGPLLIALAAAARPRPLFAALSALLWLPATIRFLLPTAILATLPPDQRLAPNVELIRQTIPPGASVMTYDFWPSLANDYRTFSTEGSPPWSAVDYIVLTGNGSGAPGRPQPLRPEQQPVADRDYVVVVDRLNREPFALGPLRTNSGWGWGMVILKKRVPAPAG